MDVKDRLSIYLESNNILPKDMAELFGVTRQAISGILTGKSKLTTDQVILLANKYPELDLRWLLTGVEKSKEKIYLQDNSISVVEDRGAVVCPFCVLKDEQIKNLEMHRDDLRKQISLLEFNLGKKVQKA